MPAGWTVINAEPRETLTSGQRFVKGYDVRFVVHDTDTEDVVFVPDSDFLAGRTADYVQRRADAIASTIGLTNRP